MTSKVQEYYLKYATSVSVEELNNHAVTMWDSVHLGFVRKLYDRITTDTGASMSARLSYVTNTVINSIHGRDMVGIVPEIDGIIYKINDTGLLRNISYTEAFAAYVMIMRTIMGYGTNNEGEITVTTKISLRVWS